MEYVVPAEEANEMRERERDTERPLGRGPPIEDMFDDADGEGGPLKGVTWSTESVASGNGAQGEADTASVSPAELEKLAKLACGLAATPKCG